MTDERRPELLKWRGKKVYRCRLCAFDSLDKRKFEDHFAKVHAPVRIIDGGKSKSVEPEQPADKEASDGNASS